MLGAAALSNVLSAPSSMFRAVNRGGGALTTSNASCARITSRASIGFSSLTTISRRHERRPELPIEPVWKFYAQLTREVIVKHARVAAAAWRIFRIYRRVSADAHIPYTDQAMTPVSEDETQTLELFTHNKSAREAVDHARKIKILTALGSSAVESTT